MEYPWIFVAVLFYGLTRSSQFELSCIHNSTGRAFQALKGQAVIVSVASLTRSSKEGQCDEVTSEIEILEAIRWTLKRLNDRNFMPGIDLGLISVDSCSNSGMAVDSALRVLREFENGSCPCGMEANCKVFGILGPDWSSHAQKLSSVLGSLPPTSQFIQMAYETTSEELSDSEKYPNFFRVIPTDNFQVAAMTKLLVDMKSNYFAIVYQNDAYGRGAAMDLKRMAEEHGLCVSEFRAIKPDATSEELHEIAHLFLFRSKQIDFIIFFGSAESANTLMQYFSGDDKEHYTKHMNFIFSDAIGLQPRYLKVSGLPKSKSIDVALGALTFSPPYKEISEFSTHWKGIFQNLTRLKQESIQNPFLLSVYKGLSKCDPDTQQSCQPLTDEDATTYLKQNVFVRYAIEATYALAYLFRYVQGNSCTSGELCASLRNELPSHFGQQMLKIDNIDLSDLDLSEYRLSDNILRFDKNGDHKYPTDSAQYEVYNYKKCQDTHCFEKVATYQDRKLLPQNFQATMSSYIYDYASKSWSETAYPSSQCPKTVICNECISKDLKDAYYYSAGDYIIIGVAPIYIQPTDSSRCGELYETVGASIGEAIAYAIDDIQERRGRFASIFPGKTLGFIIINSCNRGVIVQEKIFSIMNGQSPLGDIREKIIGFIGGLGSIISLAMSSPITELKYVQVGYGSTSSKLSDRSEHPYFMRVCTSDDKQAEAIVEVIMKMGVDYIQVVFQNEAYGRGGNLSIARAIAKAGSKICVARVHEVTEHSNFFTVLTDLRQNMYARVVVVFLRSNVIPEALKGFNSMKTGEFLIFGSEGWGKRPLILEDNPNLVGSLTTSVEMAFDKNFDDYVGKLRPAIKNKNPWLLDILEKRLKCYYPQSFNKANYEKECDENKGYTDASNYLQDTWVPFVVRAVQALCIGVSESINKRCGGTSYCDDLRDDPSIITTEMKKIQFDLFATGDQKDLFDSNGDGNVGYKIYNIQKDTKTGKPKYEDVGQWSADGHLTFRQEKMVYPGELDSIVSKCPNPATCDICFGKRSCEDTGECSEENKGQSDSTGNLPAIYALAGLCAVLVLVLVALIIIVCYHYRKRKKKRMNAKYLHPTSVEAREHENPAYSYPAADQREPPSPSPHRVPPISINNQNVAFTAHPRVHDGGSGGSSESG